ncbi:tRNA splicing ligase [Mycobacterium phage Yuna]|uniref:3'-phosphate/5'-hydroxy nucleic acid ligase n=1 Tax=Mycobacterium phage Yuna TaxID=2599885 RepID=A0A5J6TF98_9CAUD|nr:tRNA splicing ligase [Mycobacterium phage Yuna]QFG09470.1 RtcB-like RNA ligase [Mycobacterium phage Yuna]
MTPVQVSDRLINFASEVDDETLKQATETASMPFVSPHVALMPDAHYGKGSSVGTVIPTVGAVIPAAVGVDIGCGMIAARTCFDEDDLKGRDLAALRESIESAIPMSAGGYNRSLDRFAFTPARIEALEGHAERQGVDLVHSPKWREQLGTLGGGNHFIELCLDHLGRVWLFLHSGSRGVGNKIAQRHIKQAQLACADVNLPNRDLAYLVEGTIEFDLYLRELRWAQAFALANRDEMLDRFRQAFGHWMDVPAHEADAIEIAGARVNAHHNYTTQEYHGGELVWLTRKGAISAKLNEPGLIPGSMGTCSYVVEGKGNAEGLLSAPHGAGRRFSRTKARKLFTVDDLAERMVGIEYKHGEAWVDEIPDAYKPIDVVMRDAAPLVSVKAELRQILNVKGL